MAKNALFTVANLRGVRGDANEPPFGLDLVQRSTGDRLNGTPYLCEELRNLLLWLTSARLGKDFIENEWIDR